MANALYTLAYKAFLEGSIAFLSDNIKINLVTSSYTPNLGTDQFLAIIPGGAIVATSANLASKTSTSGIANAANVTFSSITGSTVTYVAMYKDTGSSATSPLILLIDTATNLPVTPNGGDIVVQWDTGTNKIFTLFEGLPEAERGLLGHLRDWLRGLRIPAVLSPQGIWIPQPRIVQTRKVFA